MEIVSAIRLIQKNERGRQYRNRIIMILNAKKASLEKEEMMRKIKEGLTKEPTDEQKENIAAIHIQRKLRGILARKRVEEVRQEELIFLGMARKPKTKEELKKDPVKRMIETMKARKYT
jgi:predicted secreted protein